MTTPTRAAPRSPRACRRATPDPPTRRQPPSTRTAASGDIHELLVAAVDEAARLLDADGAMVYLVDPATGHLRFAHDAGSAAGAAGVVRSIDLPVGVGMFGRAVAERAVVLTSDYLADPAFTHAPDTGPGRPRHRHPLDGRRAARRPATRCSVPSARSRPRADAFSPAEIGLVRALADHAAAAMANVRLIEALDGSRASSRTGRRRADAARDRGTHYRSPTIAMIAG